MNIRKVLIPIDGTERSMKSIELVKEMYSPEKLKIEIIHIKELVFIDGISISDEIKISEEYGKKLLEKAKESMPGFDVSLYFGFGYAGDEIVKRAEEQDIDIIVMTKSTKKGFSRIIGSVTNYVLKHTDSIVMIVPE
ncbi:universal stress protein [Peptostreptococcus sp. D1]|uniref:universal stress protein n=1 Tax=Peptostreptococcus sp. D1 TaxID=72304 RepID=UPI0008E163A7|nr:universal stress protein [Peptostreptococcus sp. D1]SFE32813.1 Nucleotide-binding universal stress protein, UspA family [Peptostreptococcus sp. D1]